MYNASAFAAAPVSENNVNVAFVSKMTYTYSTPVMCSAGLWDVKNPYAFRLIKCDCYLNSRIFTYCYCPATDCAEGHDSRLSV